MTEDQITKLADRIMSRIEADQAIHKDALVETIMEAVTLAKTQGFIAKGATPMVDLQIKPGRVFKPVDPQECFRQQQEEWMRRASRNQITPDTQAVTIGTPSSTTLTTRSKYEPITLKDSLDGFVYGETRLDPGGDEWTLDETFERIVRVKGSRGRVDWMARGEWKAMPVKAVARSLASEATATIGRVNTSTKPVNNPLIPLGEERTYAGRTWWATEITDHTIHASTRGIHRRPFTREEWLSLPVVVPF